MYKMHSFKMYSKAMHWVLWHLKNLFKFFRLNIWINARTVLNPPGFIFSRSNNIWRQNLDENEDQWISRCISNASIIPDEWLPIRSYWFNLYLKYYNSTTSHYRNGLVWRWAVPWHEIPIKRGFVGIPSERELNSHNLTWRKHCHIYLFHCHLYDYDLTS